MISNSSYFGSLIEQKSEEVNVNLENISQFSLLLSSSYMDYNYVMVDGKYYFLDGYKYYNNEKSHFTYKIDILRTVHEMDMTNHEVRLNRFSNLLYMTPEQRNYFWKNQEIKLNPNIIEKYDGINLKYSNDPYTQQVWEDVRWVYIWLQPRSLQKYTVGALEFPYKYMFERLQTESVIEVLSTDLPIGMKSPYWKETFLTPKAPDLIFHYANGQTGVKNFWYDYPINQLYYLTDAQMYVRYVEKRLPTYDSGDYLFGKKEKFRLFLPEADISFGKTKYYMNDCPVVEMNGIPNSLYCLVLPTTKVKIIREYSTHLGTGVYEAPWSADDVLPFLFDAQSTNAWGEYIVDMKVSMIPPFELSDTGVNLLVDDNLPALKIKQTVKGDHLNGITNLFVDTKVTENDDDSFTSDSKLRLFLPFLRKQPAGLFDTYGAFSLPTVNKDSVIKRKYMLSIAEQRIELDIPLLVSDNATKLVYYEDLNPGRTNMIVGFVPEYESVQDRLYYLLHSPSTMFISRDTSMPVFTTAYQNYLANNKNFIQQAELQRNTQLANSLINAGSQAAGATGVAAAVPSYSPMAAYSGALSQGVSALLTHNMQKQVFNWNIDNMKNAPGNYKAASATVTFMLTLDLYNVWIETFRSNDFDVDIYEDMISEVGYAYYNFQFNLKYLLERLYEGQDEKKYLSAVLTGLTFDYPIQRPLLLILQRQLQEGVNIYL